MITLHDDKAELHYEMKTIWRGRLHAGAAVVALILTVLFWQRHPYSLTWGTLLLYGASMTELYSFSAIFHLGTWRESTYRKMLAMDQASIFVSIMSTTTVLLVNLMSGTYRYVVLAGLWLLTLYSIKYAATKQAFRWLSPLLCVLLGSPAIIALPMLLPRISLLGASLILGSALCHGGGAYIYTRCQPDLLPGVFGYHELFHLISILGTAATTAVIWIWVI